MGEHTKKHRGRDPGWGHARKLSDDIGQQRILDDRDLVLEPQFALLEPRDLELISRTRFGQRRNGRVEIAVFGAQQFELLGKLCVIHVPATRLFHSYVRRAGP